MKKIIIVLIRPLFFLLDLIIPKENIFIFTSKAGSLFDGNTSALYNYMTSRGIEAYFIKEPYQLKSMVLSLRAKTVFLSHGVGDLPYALHSFRKNVVYLGHGITIKKMLFEDKGLSFKRLIFSGLESRFYSHVIASSETDKNNLARVFRLSKERIFVTGLPRNDVLISPKKLNSIYSVDGKFVLYAPTYRPGTPIKLFPFTDVDLISLNEFLKQNRVFIVVRLHPNEKEFDQTIFSYSNILRGNRDTIPDVQDYLLDFSAVITDYSSIYIDFLMSDRPVAFIPYDLENYVNSTGLFFKYEEVTPGPHLSKQSQLIIFLSNLENDDFKVERSKVRRIFYKYEDFNSCERVLRLFDKG